MIIGITLQPNSYRWHIFFVSQWADRIISHPEEEPQNLTSVELIHSFSNKLQTAFLASVFHAHTHTHTHTHTTIWPLVSVKSSPPQKLPHNPHVADALLTFSNTPLLSQYETRPTWTPSSVDTRRAGNKAFKRKGQQMPFQGWGDRTFYFEPFFLEGGGGQEFANFHVGARGSIKLSGEATKSCG